LIAGSSSHRSETPKRRGRVESCPGLWWRRRADGTLAFEVKLRQDGLLHSTTLPIGTTERQAKTAWKKASSHRDEGGRPMTRNVRLDEVAELALTKLDAEARSGVKSDRTAAMYRSHYTRFISPSLGRKRLAKLTGTDIVGLISRLRDDGYAEWSINGIVTALRYILRFARPDFMAHDPFALLTKGDLPQQRPREEFEARVLRVDEIDKLVASATHGFCNIAAVAGYCGLRASEIAGLVWEDISFVDGCIHVRAQLAPGKPGERPRRVKLKSAASYRTVVLLDRAADALLDQLKREHEKGLGRETDFVFTNDMGKPYSRNQISKGIARAARRAGLGKVGAQVLRRSAATLRAYAGVPKHVAAKEMGHTPTVFERSYAKVYEDAQDMEETRTRLATIGFGVRPVDQPLTNDA
jgi:integrase